MQDISLQFSSLSSRNAKKMVAMAKMATHHCAKKAVSNHSGMKIASLHTISITKWDNQPHSIAIQFK